MNSLNRLFKDWVVPILIAALIALAINKFLFFQVSVPTGSMYPTIKPGDRIIVTRIHNYNNLKRGDIVVFYSQELGETLIKRLIGLPNDIIDIKNGIVYVNGVKTDEPYVVNHDTVSGEYKVPPDEYFFLGDNRSDSDDARYWKNHYITQNYLEGRALFTIFPFSHIGKLK